MVAEKHSRTAGVLQHIFGSAILPNTAETAAATAAAAAAAILILQLFLPSLRSAAWLPALSNDPTFAENCSG
jgi:hypothetical protein